MNTPENLNSLEKNQIFVFGSNRAGRHGKGAALVAARKFGAKYGQGDGLMGQSYGIPTKDKNLKSLPIEKVGIAVQRFKRFAAEHKELTFFVTKIGCGLAGFKEKDIAPMFNESSENIVLPIEFTRILGNHEELRL